MRRLMGAVLVAISLGLGSGAFAEEFIVLQSTTSTDNSGLLGAILPAFEATSGIEVRVVAVGTGQALRNGRAGDGDVILVHDRVAEERFVADGWGVARHEVMYNDFVLVGPVADPAAVAGETDIVAALRAIAEAQSPFVSRGDDSGTHKAELRFWAAVGEHAPAVSGDWYREIGAGMGATLTVAVGTGAYALTDRATWMAFGRQGDHAILLEGDARMRNLYGVILVNPERHRRVKADAGQRFIDWLTGPLGQAAIAAFRVAGEQVFFPSATSRDLQSLR